MERIAVLGIGKLGICMALHLDRAGYAVIGVDIDADYVDRINDRSLCSSEPGVEESLQAARQLRASTDLEDALQDDIELIFVFVATPSTPAGGYDHQQIERIADGLRRHGRRSRPVHLVIGCTTMPGYCNALAVELEPYGYTVSYNPEFIAQGRIMRDLAHPDQVLIGEADHGVGERLEAIYRRLCRNEPHFHRMDRLSAEITKLATNCFLTTKIAFANAIGDLALTAGAQPDAILNAIGSDSRIGPKYLGYGYGFGGPCFPRDNRALGHFARSCEYPLEISDATDRSNARHLEYQLTQLLQAHPPEATITFDSVSYKPESELLVESQQLALALALVAAGRKVRIRERRRVIRELEVRYPGRFVLECREEDQPDG